MFEDTKKTAADRTDRAVKVAGTGVILGLLTLAGLGALNRGKIDSNVFHLGSITRDFEKEGLDPMSIRLDSKNEVRVDPDRHLFKLRQGTDQASAEVFLVKVGYTDVKSAGVGAAVIFDCGVTERVLESIRRGVIEAK